MVRENFNMDLALLEVYRGGDCWWRNHLVANTVILVLCQWQIIYKGLTARPAWRNSGIFLKQTLDFGV